MALAPSSLLSLSEAQHSRAQQRFTIIRPVLELEITRTDVVSTHQLSLRTVRRWMKSYQERVLAGLADSRCADKGTARSLPQTAIHLTEGLTLQTPPPSAESIQGNHS